MTSGEFLIEFVSGIVITLSIAIIIFTGINASEFRSYLKDVNKRCKKLSENDVAPSSEHKKLSSEHGGLSSEDGQLSSRYSELPPAYKELLHGYEKMSELFTLMCNDQQTILSTVTTVEKMLIEEMARQEMRYSNLNDLLKDLKTNTDCLGKISSQCAGLFDANQRLKAENGELRGTISELLSLLRCYENQHKRIYQPYAEMNGKDKN